VLLKGNAVDENCDGIAIADVDGDKVPEIIATRTS
jgi:hypothetical protein